MSKRTNIILLNLSLMLLLAIRLLPGLKAPLSTFGYDFGFYLHAFRYADNLALTTVFGSFFGGYGNPLFVITNLLHLPPEAALYLIMAVLTIACAFVLYQLFDDKKAGLWAIILFALSVPQALAYHMFLLKNMFGLLVLLLAMWAVIKKHYKWLAITTPLVLLLHRTTSIIYALVVGINFSFILFRQKKYKLLIGLVLGLTLILIAVYPWLRSLIKTFLAHPNASIKEGVFLSGNDLLINLLPYAILAIIGAYFYIKNRNHQIVLALLFVPAIWIALRLPFYNRAVVYVDLAIIILAAFGLGKIQWKRSLISVVAVVNLGLIAYNAIVYQTNKAPLIEESDLQEIQTVTAQESGSFILATSATDAPWLLGYGTKIRLASPGLFEDHHTYQQWLDFWEGHEQQNFVNDYPEPLLLYQRSFKVEGSLAECLKPISINFYRVECQ